MTIIMKSEADGVSPLGLVSRALGAGAEPLPTDLWPIITAVALLCSAAGGEGRSARKVMKILLLKSMTII